MDLSQGQASWMNDWLKVIDAQTNSAVRKEPDPKIELYFLEKAKTYEEKLSMNTEGLRKLSRIKLKKKRSLKKFLKYPNRYIVLPSFPSIFPMSMRVATKTIGLNLVTVQPMNGPIGQILYMDPTFTIKQNHLGIEYAEHLIIDKKD